jgi:hypothetical protein
MFTTHGASGKGLAAPGACWADTGAAIRAAMTAAMLLQ